MLKTRRTLRITVAVAGMAALGFGLAGTAVAAPAGPPKAPPAAQSAPAESHLVQSASPLAALTSLAPGRELPALLGVQAPGLNTDGMSASTPLTRQLTTADLPTGR